MPSDCDVSAVFGDRKVCNEIEVVFYLGKTRAVAQSGEYLVTGSRRIDRGVLHPEKPFFFDD